VKAIMKYGILGSWKVVSGSTIAIVLALFSNAVRAADDKPAQPQTISCRITGLCCPKREDDLRETVKRMADVKLLGIDFKNAEATLAYDPAQLFPNAPAKEVAERFNKMLGTASVNTFAVNPAPRAPKDKLKLVEIPVVGLDCKGCCLGAYEAIYKIEGVEHATASFKDGRVTALIDPAKTDRSTLEAALKQRGVALKAP
jgi:copper chaperone CopZ